MKRKIVYSKILAVLLPLLSLFVSACQGSVTSPSDVYYTVYYESEHGTAPESKKVISGTVLKPEDLPKLTATGYTFEGWYKGDSLITPELQYSVNADLFLKARWTEDVAAPVQVFYNITYMTTYGQAPQSKKVLSGTKLTDDDLPELSEQGYTFEGWYIGTTKISADYEVISDITLTAKWSIAVQPVSITYVSDYGTAPAAKTVPSGYTLTQDDLPVLTAEGHTFDAWYIGGVKIQVGQKVTCDITLTANWGTEPPPVVQVTIAYQTDHGTVESKTVDPGYILSTDADLPNLLHEGFEFGGWYINDRLITKDEGYTVFADVTLVAKWTPYYTISYSTEYLEDPAGKTVLSGYALTQTDLQPLSYDGYNFDGWYFNNQKVNVGDTVTSDITLTAKWSVIMCTITYVSDYSQAPQSKQIQAKTKLAAADLPAQDNAYSYTFEGWYIGTTKITADSNYEVNSDITLTAKWNPINFTITYQTQYGTNPPAITVLKGTELTASYLQPLECDGYIFDGWYLNNAAIPANYTVTSNITLVAQWTPLYTVSYFTQYGTAPAAKTVLKGTTLTTTDLPDLTTNGYTFDGWYLDTQKIIAGYEVTSNITLMATWLKTYTVTYVSERGEVPPSQDFVEKTVLGSNDLQPLTANGYTFDGWYAGNTKITGSYQVTGNVTLTGKWNYTISYSTEHGTTQTSKPVLSGYKLTQTDLPTLSDSDGYRFTGWKIGSQSAAVNYTVADNIILTAQWVAIPSGVSLFVEAGSGVTQDELNFALTSVKSGDDYILTATPGYDVYLWSVDEINLYDEEYFYYDVNTVEDDLYYGNIPTEITSNTLTFNENTLPSGVSADGTYVVYVQAFKKIKVSQPYGSDYYVYERVGLEFIVIKM